MRKYNTKALVLKSIKYKDTDKIYTLLSGDYGKISAIGRGVRRIKSRRSGNLDTLNLVNVKITESSSGFKSIDEVETINSFSNIKADYEKTAKAYYVAELVHKSVEEDSTASDVFDLVEKVLTFMDKDMFFIPGLVSYFELSLLRLLGYQVNLSKLKELNVPLYETVRLLGEGAFEKVDPKSIERVDVFIKSYIYEYLADKLKSLEL